MKKVAVVGFGSIGKRHARNFKAAGAEVAVVSRRPLTEVDLLFRTLQDCLREFKPDIVVICNETHLHHVAVKSLKSEGFTGLILVEKPVFDLTQTEVSELKDLNIRVMYNLRFNPLLRALQKEISNEALLSAHIYVGQNLKTWRSGDDYRRSYSAKADEGGGVLLDLSHEIDYSLWLFGRFRELVSCVEKISNLEILSCDHCTILLRGHQIASVNIEMNYIDHMTQRFIIVNTQNNTYHVDLVKNTFKKNNIDFNMESAMTDSYGQMVQNILQHNAEALTTFDDALEVLRIARAAMSSNQNRQWSVL